MLVLPFVESRRRARKIPHHCPHPLHTVDGFLGRGVFSGRAAAAFSRFFEPALLWLAPADIQVLSSLSPFATFFRPVAAAVHDGPRWPLFLGGRILCLQNITYIVISVRRVPSQEGTHKKAGLSMTGRDFRDARRKKGWTQEETAEKLRVTQAYLSMLESGRRSMPWVTQDSHTCGRKRAAIQPRFC